MEGIRDINFLINLKNSTLLVKDLKRVWIFEDKTKEKRASIIGLVLAVLRLLKRTFRE